MKTIPVILAGGIGERFWPLSRSSMPKQLLKLISDRTMAEETLARVSTFSSKGVKPLIITSKAIAERMQELLPKKWQYDLIIEPVGKNTAPPVALAAAWIEKKYKQSVMVVLSADHDIRPLEKFTSAMEFAVKLATDSKQLIVFGVKPSRPDTGYGYIKLGEKIDGLADVSGFHVKKFIEKPDLKKAKKYVKSGNYMWNSGMFVWTTSVILEEFKAYMPELFKQVKDVEIADFSEAAMNNFYHVCNKESIDYGIMEHSQKVSAAVGEFGWDDIGSWESIPRLKGTDSKGTVADGEVLYSKENKDSIIVNKSSLAIAAIGLKNVAFIATDDGVLAIDRSLLPDLKTYLNEIKADKRFPKTLF